MRLGAARTLLPFVLGCFAVAQEATLFATVVDSHGQAVEGARVLLFERRTNPADCAERHRLELTADARGRVRAPLRPARSYCGFAHGPKTSDNLLSISPLLDSLQAGRVAEFVVQPRPAFALTLGPGSRAWSREQPVRLVQLLDQIPGSELDLGPLPADGVLPIAFTGLASRLQLRDQSGAPLAAWEVDRRWPRIDVGAPRDIQIELRDDDGRAIADAPVEMMVDVGTVPAAWQRSRSLRTWLPIGRSDAGGALAARVPMPDFADFVFRTKRPGFANAIVPARSGNAANVDRGPLAIRLTVPAIPRVTGRLVNGPRPLAGVQVRIATATATAEHDVVTTGADGTFLSEGISQEAVDLTLHFRDPEAAGDVPGATVVPIMQRHGRREFGALDLAVFQRVAVQVRDERRGPAVGVTVLVHPLRPMHGDPGVSMHRVAADNAGRVDLLLAPGNWQLIAGDDQRLGEALVQPAGVVTVLDLEALTAVRCRVVDQNGVLVPGAALATELGRQPPCPRLAGDVDEHAAERLSGYGRLAWMQWSNRHRTTGADGSCVMYVPSTWVGHLQLVARALSAVSPVTLVDEAAVAGGLELTLPASR